MLGTLMLGTYIFIIIKASLLLALFSLYSDLLYNCCYWLKVCFELYKYSYFCSHLVSTCLEYLFLYICFNPICSLKQKWISGRLHIIVPFSFLMHPVTLCFLIRESNPFVFRIINNNDDDIYGLSNVILLVFFFFFVYFVPFFSLAACLCELILFHCGMLAVLSFGHLHMCCKFLVCGYHDNPINTL